MHRSYRQLACDERCQIKALMSGGDSIRRIAGHLGRDPSTISREIARNSGQRGCRHRQAQDRTSTRRREASGVPRKLTGALW
ncbi:MAG: helix-turn-helix domain-containing protein, partial [Gammaproteobacteria bacterium]|nr:helix-turn-helix domain-containing protein [Gammaproteobacteria bacterium]